MVSSRRRSMGKDKQIMPVRGEIFLVDFDLTVGSEIKKIRPALILQNDLDNKYSSITIVAAITSKIITKPHPSRVIISEQEGGLDKPSVVLLSQIRSVDKQRLMKRLGFVNQQTMRSVDFAIKISLGLIEL